MFFQLSIIDSKSLIIDLSFANNFDKKLSTKLDSEIHRLFIIFSKIISLFDIYCSNNVIAFLSPQ
jgi:hypothetical protein